MPKKPKLPANAPKLALTGESQPPDWSRARQYLEGIKTFTRFAIAGRILLGHELLTLKTELGFVGRGGDRAKPHDAVLLGRTWEQWCKSQLGMSDDTADRAIETYEAAKSRLKRLGGAQRTLKLLETPAAKLDDEARKTLSALVDGIEWGDSLKELMEEFRIFKRHVAISGGATPPAKKPANPEQLLFAMFVPLEDTIEKANKAAEKLRLGPDYQHLLYALPLVSSEPGKPSLTALKAQLEAILNGDLAKTLDEINAVLDVRKKDPNAKPAAKKSAAA